MDLIKLKLYTPDEKYVGELKKVVSAKHTDEINGENVLDFVTLSPVYKNELLLYKDTENNYQEFKITGVDAKKTIAGTIYDVYAEHSSYETLGDFIEEVQAQDTTAAKTLPKVLLPTRWVAGIIEPKGEASVELYQISCKEGIQRVAQAWGAELQYRTMVDHNTNYIGTRYIDILNERGHDLGKRFTYSKDLIEITRTIHKDNVITALYGYGKGLEIDPDDEMEQPIPGTVRRLSFEGVNEGKAYVENNEARLLWGRPTPSGGKAHVFDKVTFDHVEDPTELRDLTTAELAKKSTPLVTYTAKVVDLKAYGIEFIHEGVSVGDHVAVIDKEFDPELRIKARVVRIERDLLEPDNTVITLGNFMPGLEDDAVKQQEYINNFRDKQGIWDRAQGFDENGKVDIRYIDNVINGLNTMMNALGGYTYISDEGDGITTYDKPIDQNPQMAIQLKGGAFRIASGRLSNGEFNWRTFGDGFGFTADEITTGILKGGMVKFDLENGTLLVGNSVDDYLLYFDGTTLKFGAGTLGDLKGEPGQSSYIHTAWADSPDGLNFTLDSPGPRKWIGTAVSIYDYPPENYYDYNWVKIKGEDGTDGVSPVYTLLSNEAHVIPTDHNGNNGNYSGAVSTLLMYLGTVEDTDNWTYTITPGPGVTGVAERNKFSVTGMAGDTGQVTFTANKLGYPNYSKVFKLSKNRKAKDGEEGVDATSYWLVSDVKAIKHVGGGVYEPSVINVKARSQTGDQPVQDYDGRFRIRESEDGVNWVGGWTSGTMESHVIYEPHTNPNTKFIYIQLYGWDLDTGNWDDIFLLDEEQIVVVSDGEDGLPGEDGEQGPPGIPGYGEDGVSTYLHIKYSNNGGANFTGNSGTDLGSWIGTLTSHNPNPPTQTGAYTWSKFIGVDGDSVHIQYSANQNGPWVDDYITGHKFMRQRIGEGTWTGAIKIVGEDGDEFKVEYSVDGQGSWHTTWTYEDMYMRTKVGANPWQGPMKIVGNDGFDGDILQMEWSENPDGPWHITFQPGYHYMRQRVGPNPWSPAIKVTADDIFIQYSERSNMWWEDTFDPSKHKYMRQRIGLNGVWSAAMKIIGEDGVSNYTYVRWSTYSDGSYFNNVSTGKDYMGIAVTTSPTPPTDKVEYTWSKYVGPPGSKGEIGDTGPSGPPGTPGASGAPGASLQIQYSTTGSSWHSTFSAGDKFMRQRLSNSSTWSNAIKIVGEDANMLGWVQAWNDGMTNINGQWIVTPQVFAGEKHNDGTITGVFLGQGLESGHTGLVGYDRDVHKATINGAEVFFQTNQFLLELTDTDGEVISSMTAENQGFQQMHVDKFTSPSVVQREADGGTFYVNYMTGDDEAGNGSYSNPYGTIEGVWEHFGGSKYLDSDVYIILSSDYHSNIVFEGFTGPGEIRIAAGSRLITDYITIKGCTNKIKFENMVIDYTQSNSIDRIIEINACNRVEILSVVIRGHGKIQKYLQANHGSTVVVSDSQFYGNTQDGFVALNNSQIFIWNTKGTSSRYALRGTYGGIVGRGGYMLAGPVSTWNGGFEFGAATSNSGTAPAPPPSNPVKTITVRSHWCNTYRYGQGWRSENEARQGNYGYGSNDGLWGFDLAPLRSASDIKQMRLTITRDSSGGQAGPVPVYLYTHNYNSRPGGVPSLTNVGNIGSLKWGETKTFTISATVMRRFRTSNARGFAVRATSRAAYSIFKAKATVVATYD